MPVPAELADAPAWRVHTRRGLLHPLRVQWGPFSADTVNLRDTRQRGGVLDIVGGKREFQQEFSFVIRDTLHAVRWTARCDGRDRERGVTLGSVDVELGSGMSLDCDLRPGADSAGQWKLQLSGRNGSMPGGTIHRADVRYEITGEAYPGDDETGWPLGYLLSRDGVPVAVVDRTHPGSVRMSPALPADDRALLAAAATALLLQQRLITDD
ncbi:hypothetical protein [Longimicrobium terrae]|uniref:Uncharacterized protein n=1 Tax=Longimicrobium terrae TaxID=1639882 RepID=A0A841H4Q7_9BACT|nr:hypothetical protein [Longimicrobium terrae]MBB4638725.1 hypothetical protein [Longimicrobium terrae]MBB6072964.1 hypothetical protein [Longimicrobium terrae]NNC33089.1 hypothetical protein [Longimicrobium terrae]